MNKDVAPVSVIASVVTMVIALRYCFIETPNICQAMAAKLGRFAGMPEVVLLDSGVVEQLDVAIVMPLLLFSCYLFISYLFFFFVPKLLFVIMLLVK